MSAGEDERMLRAAEHVLGLLDEEERARARDALRRDPALRREAEFWEERFAGLVDELEPRAPPPRTWRALNAAIEADRRPWGFGVWRSLVFWRAASGAGFATAGVLAVLMMGRPFDQPSQASRPPLVAALFPKEGPAHFFAAYDVERATFLITPAGSLQAAGRAPQLWLTPKDGEPIALGVVDLETPRAVAVPAHVAILADAQAGLVITLEPPGGAPEGVATGPVVAHGRLSSF